MAFYTGTGDAGETGLLGKTRVKKDSPIVEALGTVDELASAIGVAVVHVKENEVKEKLEEVQNDLFSIAAVIAAFSDKIKTKANLQNIDAKRLEMYISSFEQSMPKTKEFVLPGRGEASSYLHLARAIARRAERRIVAIDDATKDILQIKRYMNRLSSFLFVCALYVDAKSGIAEAHPTY